MGNPVKSCYRRKFGELKGFMGGKITLLDRASKITAWNTDIAEYRVGR